MDTFYTRNEGSKAFLPNAVVNAEKEASIFDTDLYYSNHLHKAKEHYIATDAPITYSHPSIVLEPSSPSFSYATNLETSIFTLPSLTFSRPLSPQENILRSSSDHTQPPNVTQCEYPPSPLRDDRDTEELGITWGHRPLPTANNTLDEGHSERCCCQCDELVLPHHLYCSACGHALCSLCNENQNLEEPSADNTGFGKHACTLCDQVFYRPRDLRKHEKVHLEPNERQHKCDLCTQTFHYPKDLERHKRSKHSNVDANPEHVCPVTDCEYATRGFSRRDKLLQHMRRRHPYTEFEASPSVGNSDSLSLSASESLSRETSLSRSSRISHTCVFEDCTASFTRLADLQRHQITVHTTKKRFPCSVPNCSRVDQRGFTRRDHLTEHLRSYHAIAIPKRKPGQRVGPSHSWTTSTVTDNAQTWNAS